MARKTAKTKKTGECALCGASGEMTREHVPPQCLFLKPHPQNTITVPLCKTCNHSYHPDDEYFRLMIASSLQPSDAQWALWHRKVVGSSFARSEALRARLREDSDLLQRLALNGTVEFQDGSPVPENMQSLLMGFDRVRINRVIEKIVRCLHFHHHKRRLQGQISVEKTCPDDSLLKPTVFQPK
jgi:hypothetical protein